MLAIIAKFIIVLLLVSYLPLITYSFYKSSYEHRDKEIDLLIERVGLERSFAELHGSINQGWHLILATIFASFVSFVGLSTLFFSYDVDILYKPNLLLGGIHVTTLISADDNLITDNTPKDLVDVIKANKDSIFVYQQQALFVFGMSFLGAYLWGLQYFARRYLMNDLVPGAFYHFAIRMIFSAIIALLIYHSSDLIGDSHLANPDESKTNAAISFSAALPAIAFFVGMFPQRGVKWLGSKLSFMSTQNTAVRELPLTMIEGLTEYHVIRLEEAGIDNCYNLSNADFITLILTTPYEAREVIDWILQAKLCVRFGHDVSILRAKGFRTVLDLLILDEQMVVELAKDSALIESQLRRIVLEVQADNGLKRLLEVGRSLSTHCKIS